MIHSQNLNNNTMYDQFRELLHKSNSPPFEYYFSKRQKLNAIECK